MEKQTTATRLASSPSGTNSSQSERPVKKRPGTALKPKLSPEQILGAFRGSIEPVRVPASYRLGILLVAFVMVLLPLIYVGIIGLVAYSVYWHAVSNTAIFSGARGRGAFLALLIYLAPMVVGGILVVFMFKPLFSRPARNERRRTLFRKDQPLLFDFVDRICDAVGSARPRRIDLDGQVNASASFRRGWLSFLGSDLVLTIGMPLVAGMNMRQFAGVLAHEFGHFSQGVGMRLTYVIRAISHWFTRVVYERDHWDEKLKNMARGIDLRIGWILYLAQFFVWCTRKILWVLMMIGHAVSGLMLRQMEFDADRYEARLAGSDTFASTARQLQVLGLAHHGAMSDLGDFYREGRLADDLAALIMANVEDLPKAAFEHVDKHLHTSTTGWLDTHPADKERIASAQREAAPGIFRLEAAASLLFGDFARESKKITWDFYREIFGEKLRREDVHSIDELLKRRGEEHESFKALHRYFQAQYNQLRPLNLPQWTAEAPEVPKACAAQLKDARQRMLAALPAHREQFKRYDEADTRTIAISQARALADAKFKIARDTFTLDLSSPDRLQRAAATLRQERQQLASGLAAFETAAAERLYCALQLARVEKVADRLQDAPGWQAEVKRLLTALEAVNRQAGGWLKLRNDQAAMGLLFQQLEGSEGNEALLSAIRQQMQAINNAVRTIRGALNGAAYPFDHAKGEISIGTFALPDLPDGENPAQLFEAAETMAFSLSRLAARTTGRLCVLAEEVEGVLGLERLEEPEEGAEGEESGG